MKESLKREYERLETLDDYFAEFERLGDISDTVPVKQLDKICKILSNALLKKYKYVIKFSAPYRRKQSFWSLQAEKRQEKKEQKEQQEAENEQRNEEFKQELLAKLASPPCPALEGQNDPCERAKSWLVEDTQENPQKQA